MPFFITSPCVGEKDMSCVEECPVDCIYEGGSKLYINPKECIDCGACEPVCPVDAIASDLTSTTPENEIWKADNARYFYEPLPGKTEPLSTRAAPATSARSISTPSWPPRQPTPTDRETWSTTTERKLMGKKGRVFVRGLTSETYGLGQFRAEQLAAVRVRDDSVVVDDAKVGHSGDSSESRT